MSSHLLKRLAPGISAKFNLGVDLMWFWTATVLASIWSGRWGTSSSSDLATFLTVATIAWLLTATSLRHYDPASDRDVMDDAAMVSVLVLAVTTVLALISLATPNTGTLPRLPEFLVLMWPTLLALRLLVFRHIAAREAPLDEVLIVGVGAMGRFTAEDIIKKGRRHVVGFMRFDDEKEPESLSAPFMGPVSELEQLLRTVAVSEVYVAGNSLKHGEAMQAAIKVCEKFGIPFALPAYPFRLDRARPVASKTIADGYVHYVSIDVKPGQMALKRLFDIVLSSLALWALLPLFTVVAVLIKLTSRGPILFRQHRVGLYGKSFNMLKFRSMVINAEELKAKLEKLNEQAGPVFKMKNDPRVTGIGRFIRKFSIDELPQLVNVLRGDMSIVGPRPPVPPEVAKYEAWQRRRLSVRPGLTCIWQVSGRNQISFDQWMYMDMEYIDHWSLRNDVSLILKTFPVVFTGRGAS
ncbi:MAG: sugar transferase [Myxococcaceae bacterium]|nr:sugar transferase [Myxococcaceae bacterium]